MTVVLIHNRYLEAGGEDAVFAQESELLEDRGHRVSRIEVGNEGIEDMGWGRLATSLFWNRDSALRVARAVSETGATVAHFHNTFPLISPAAYYAARRSGAAVVQTLHNFRLICPGGMLMREGRPCEDCVGSSFGWRGVSHGCYRESRVASAGVASMVAVHRAAGTWNRQVDRYIALTSFARDRFVRGGLPADRLDVRPNFLAQDPGRGDHTGGYALFVGRLTEQKGIRVLLEAWRQLDGSVPLRIVGSGELDERVVGSAAGVEWVGPLPRAAVLEAMKGALFLVQPSLSYENFPMTVIEAFATGLPVVAPGIGSLAEIVEADRSGLHFEPGSPDSLAAVVREAWQRPEHLRRLGNSARSQFRQRYDAQSGYNSLIAVYERARASFENMSP